MSEGVQGGCVCRMWGFLSNCLRFVGESVGGM